MLASDRTRFVAIALLLASVFLMGGGSRHDILSLPLLRPICILLGAYAVTVAARGQIETVRAPLYMLAALAVLIASQLIPLPPGLWAALPGHDLYDEAVEAAGVGDVWRPLSLSPARTLNSLMALSAPAAALLLFAVQGPGYRRRTLLAVAALGMLSSLWGLLQLAGSSSGFLYLYRITNEGLPVGLFANRNHQAVLLAALIPLLTYLGLTAGTERNPSPGARLAALAAGLLMVATAVMTGSRAGLIATIIAFAAAAYMMHAHQRTATPSGRNKTARGGSRWRVIGIVLLALAIAGATLIWFGRALALERIFASDQIEDIRGDILPILMKMVQSFFPTGSGFGAFDHAYDRFEPTALLSGLYLNQAHNDWLQLLIEGGAAAAALLLIFLVWVGRQVLLTVRLARKDPEGVLLRRIAALAFLLILGISSLFDYPLRVPSIMAVFAIFCAALAESDSPAAAASPERPERARSRA